MQLLIAVVNYRSAGMVCDVLDSIAEEVRALGGVRVRVGDNGSGDDSVEVLSRHVRTNGYGDFAEVLDLQTNAGFAAGNNRLMEGPLNGPEHERPEFVLMLNPDTIATPGCLGALLEFMRAHPTVGLAGSQLIDPDGTVQQSSFRFLGLASEIDELMRFGPVTKLLTKYRVSAPQEGPDPRATQWVAGASLIVRREVFETIGLMDETYFLYYEEVDFIKRAADAGFECWYVPASRVIHLVGQTSGITNKDDAKRRKPGFWFETRKRYFITHHGAFKALLIDAAWVPAYLTWRARRLLQRKQDTDPARYLTDHVKHGFFTSRRLKPAQIPQVVPASRAHASA